MTKKNGKLGKKYEIIHRFFTALNLYCFLISTIGMALAGNRVITITLYSCVIIFVLSLIEGILLRAWRSIEDIKNGAK